MFSLIGPKRYDAPWKQIEQQGYISPAACYEVRVDLPADERLEYAAAADDQRYRLAATAPAKIDAVRDIVARHDGEQVLVIGQYLDQLQDAQRRARRAADQRIRRPSTSASSSSTRSATDP